MADKRLPKPTIKPQQSSPTHNADSAVQFFGQAAGKRLTGESPRNAAWLERIVGEKQKWERARADMLRVLERLEPTQAQGRENVMAKIREFEKKIESLNYRLNNWGVRNKKQPATPRERPQALCLDDPRRRASYSQEEAGQLLSCGNRQIRNLVKQDKLNRAAKGRIVNDEKLKAEYGARHTPHTHVKYP